MRVRGPVEVGDAEESAADFLARSPDEVEFWQGDERRRHVRLHYARDGESWARRLLWP